MNSIKLVICLVIVLFAFSASAQIYKYTDDDGNVRYTDDLNQVPMDQRDSASTTVEIESETEEEEVAEDETEQEELAEDSEEFEEETESDENEMAEEDEDLDESDEYADEEATEETEELEEEETDWHQPQTNQKPKKCWK